MTHWLERSRWAGRALLAVAVGSVWACGGPPAPATPSAVERAMQSAIEAAAEIRVTEPTAQRARSSRGMVASASVPASEVGARILAVGGNAADAAVATGFALAVTEPGMSGIAGRASIVIHTPRGSVHGIDGLNTVPAAFAEGGAPGYDRAAVPGVVAALTRLHDEFGSLPLTEVMAPAIGLAEEGFELPVREAERLAAAAEELARFPASRALFLRPDGTAPAQGERLVQENLARTLRAIAREGPEVFYEGWIADSIHADMARNGGFITREDLAAYEALDAILVEGRYRGHTLVSNFRPASGHAVIQALQTLEALPDGASLMAGEGTWAALVGQAMHQAIGDRGMSVGTEEESAAYLTSPAHARERADELRLPGATQEVGAAQRVGAAAGHPGVADHPGYGGAVATEGDRESTTHFSVVDEAGMVVSITQSLGPSMGTRLVAPGLGFLYATRLGSEPGSRPSSTIAPTLVLTPGGEPYLALGGAGDARIISAVIQVVSRVLDQSLSLEAAVAAPRVHPTDPGELRMEEAPWAPGTRTVLEELGFQVEPTRSSYFGRVHAVLLDPDGMTGVAEPRWDGSAVGLDP